mgnify:CR=1 FL=1
MNLIDTHCHLDFHAYDTLRDDIVREAAEAGVERVLAVSSADVYGKAIWEKYRAVSNAYPNWKDVLDEFDVQIVLMDSRWTICRLLDASPEFCRVYSDSKASLYVRRDGPNARVVTDYEAGRLVIPRDSLPNRAALLGQSQPPMTRGVLGAAVPRAGS